jgi:hypothetical protein
MKAAGKEEEDEKKKHLFCAHGESLRFFTIESLRVTRHSSHLLYVRQHNPFIHGYMRKIIYRITLPLSCAATVEKSR